MKQLFLIICFAVAATVTVSGQTEYRPIESFDNDTLKFIRYNFDQNRERYVRKIRIPVDTRSPIPVISVQSVGDLQYLRQS